jgi:hypothetical protein
MAAPRTTFPACATAAARASSSASPRDEGLSKMMSRPIASGRPSAIFLMSWPCNARGNGHCSLSSAIDDSSMVTTTTSSVGCRGPRHSKS